MRKCLIPGLLLLCSYVTEAQNDHVLDSLKKGVSIAHADGDKVYALIELSNYYSGLDNKLAKTYVSQAMEIAELSRDRKLIARTWLRTGNHWLNWAGLEDNLTLA